MIDAFVAELLMHMIMLQINSDSDNDDVEQPTPVITNVCWMFCLSLYLIISVVTFTQTLCVEVLTPFCSILLCSLPVSSAALEACCHRLFLVFCGCRLGPDEVCLSLLSVCMYWSQHKLLFLLGRYLAVNTSSCRVPFHHSLSLMLRAVISRCYMLTIKYAGIVCWLLFSRN